MISLVSLIARPVAPSLTSFYLPLSVLSSLRRWYLPHLRVTLIHFTRSFYEQALYLPTSSHFGFILLVSLKSLPSSVAKTLHPLSRSCFLLSSGWLFLLALSTLLGTHYLSLTIFLFAQVWILPTLTVSYFTIS